MLVLFTTIFIHILNELLWSIFSYVVLVYYVFLFNISNQSFFYIYILQLKPIFGTSNLHKFFFHIFIVIFFISDFFSINKKQCLIVFVFKTVNIHL